MSAVHSPTPVRRSDLVIGVDGGASHTLALLADNATGSILGRGQAGPSNIQAVGEEAALRELDAAIERAFESADTPRAKVAAACLGLAGIDVAEGQDVIRNWADLVDLAGELTVANDATLLFAAGTPDGWGLAVIAGTGSIAFTLDQNGNDGRTGGWGYLLGDEGSAFRVGLQGLRAACRAADRVGPATLLLDAFLSKLGTGEPRDLIPAVYRGAWDKAAIAALAPVVLQLAVERDPVAEELVQAEARELGRTAVGAVRNAGLPSDGVPVALTGGLLLHSALFRGLFLDGLRTLGVTPHPVGLVENPAVGAIVMARKLLTLPG
jgi:N-acetylglucosamine kinase-like BadF-type ATPase